MNEIMERLAKVLSERDGHKRDSSFYQGAVQALLREMRNPTADMLEAVESLPTVSEAHIRPLARTATTEEIWQAMIDAALGEYWT